MKLYMFRTVPLSIIRIFSIYTQQYIQVCGQLASRIRTEHPDPARKLYDIQLLCVQCKTPDDGQRSCPKHVQFYSNNKFEKLVHLVGFIIRIYHDARPPECQAHLISITFPDIRAFYKIMCQNIVEPDWPQMTSEVAPCMVGSPERRVCSP